MEYTEFDSDARGDTAELEVEQQKRVMNVMLVGSLTRRDVKSEVVLRPEESVWYEKATQGYKGRRLGEE
jgi:hypothetical protein